VAKQAAAQGCKDEKQRQRQPVARPFYHLTSNARKGPKHQYQRRECGLAMSQFSSPSSMETTTTASKSRSIDASLPMLTRWQNAANRAGRRWKEEFQEGTPDETRARAPQKKPRPGKEQESSTNSKQATRHQPGCKPSHHIPVVKKSYALIFGASIRKRFT